MYNIQKHRTRNSYVFGISMRLDTMKKIDYLRGFIPRSKWISLALESIIETTIESESLGSGLADQANQSPMTKFVSTPFGGVNTGQ